MNRLKKGDQVIVTAGKDKGRRGTVLDLVGARVLVEGINVAKKHMRGNPNAGVAGGIIEKEMPLHTSNIMLYNPVTKKGDRVGFKTLGDGKKVRIFRSNGEVIDV
ncbi:MAG: 50S ribosomal protein L24 [Gammaproteobacteria bacterium]|nr:50S ribosomal protein L24 [Gammaproteobacteria bacterium]MDH3766999.1 50S ribosomal protein L24 [Gammaproteobacteria bacterium]